MPNAFFMPDIAGLHTFGKRLHGFTFRMEVFGITGLLGLRPERTEAQRKVKNVELTHTDQ